MAHIKAKENPAPDQIPQDVWDSHQHFFADRNKDNAQKNWHNYLDILRSYEQDENKNFLKDADGNFLKKPVKTEVPND